MDLVSLVLAVTLVIVGAGTVVTKDVAQGAKVVGNPAKPIGYWCKDSACVLSPFEILVTNFTILVS